MWRKLIKRQPRGDPRNLDRVIQFTKAKAMINFKGELLVYEGEPKPKEN